MSLWWVFALLGGERLFELWLAGRNRRRLLQKGGQEFFAETYPKIVTLHALFFVALIAESYPWRIPLDGLSVALMATLLLLQAGRYWCIASLGEQWNTRIILVPGGRICRRGPYRFLRHPNYLVVTLEFIAIPLLARAPLTLLLFSLANALVLRQRIRCEEAALQQHTDFSA